MWYLGAWYEPVALKALAQNRKSRRSSATPSISPKAYTQGWLWRVAQAHPMGYSDMQFGYWTRKPEPISDFIAVPHQGQGSLTMADDDIDVVIVGSGFAGSLIANELAKQGKKIVILEAGDGVPPNINDYMERFYKADRSRCRKAPTRRRCSTRTAIS